MTKVNDMIQKMKSHNYSHDEYEQFIINENADIIQELTDLIVSSYSKRQEIKSRNNIEEQEQLNDVWDTFKTSTKILSDFILKHQNDSEYVTNIIKQMPFMNRAAFINESVLSMLRNKNFGQEVEMTNALDVYERNIDKEIRERLKSKSFEELSQELYMDVGGILNPIGIRASIEKYDCINFALYRIDEELQKGIFNKGIDRKSRLKLYKFDRNIYEEHKAPNIKEIFKNDDTRRNYIENTYWVQKITTEDRERLGISDFPDLEEEYSYLAEPQEQKNEKKELFSEQEIGKATINRETTKKDKAQSQEKQDEQEIYKAKEDESQLD